MGSLTFPHIIISILFIVNTADSFLGYTRILDTFPEIYQAFPKYIILGRDESELLNCTAKGKIPITITWLKEGRILNEKTFQNESKTVPFKTYTSSVSLSKAELIDGYYQCIVKNIYGTSISDRILVQKLDLSATYTQDSINYTIQAAVGADIRLNCSKHSDVFLPPFNVYWGIENKSEVGNLRIDGVRYDNRIVQDSKNRLIFINVQQNDQTDNRYPSYVCIIEFENLLKGTSNIYFGEKYAVAVDARYEMSENEPFALKLSPTIPNKIVGLFG